MKLDNLMIKHGHDIFRWRSYIPLLFIGPLLLAFDEAAHMEAIMGDVAEDIWVLFSFIVSLSGLALRAFTVGFVPAGTSGRNAKEQRAEELNTTGMYSIVRNPLYLGNYIILLGVLLSIKVWWLLVIVSMGFFVYMERIILAEEKFLTEKFGKAYTDWCEKTPVIIPRLGQWRPPALPFSWRTVFKREYQGLLGLGTAFFITEFISDVFFEHETVAQWVEEDVAWVVIYATIVVVSLALRHLKKHTRVLHVEGR